MVSCFKDSGMLDLLNGNEVARLRTRTDCELLVYLSESATEENPMVVVIKNHIVVETTIHK